MNVALFLQVISPLLPSIIRLVEQTIPGPKKGTRKRKKVLKTIESLARDVPQLAIQIQTISQKAGKMV